MRILVKTEFFQLFMVLFEKITTTPKFSTQLEDKILYSEHKENISVSYTSTYTLKYVLEGTKYYSIDQKDFKVSKNQFLILNNKKIVTEAQKGTKGLSFFLSDKLISEVFHYHYKDEHPVEFIETIQIENDNTIGEWLHKIALVYHQDPSVFELKKDDLLIQLSELIVKDHIHIHDRFSRLNITKHKTREELYRLISLTREYLNDNITNTVTLDVISENIGVSKYYLHRIFKEIMAKTPLEYLTWIRLNKAKNKLKHSRNSIFEIAVDCGFENSSYFSNVFKKHIGISPSEYRYQL